MERKYWSLLAIGLNKNPMSPVQLQKTLFLLGEGRSEELAPNFYRFEPYNYGPFCADVYRDAEQLEAEGLVSIDREQRSWAQYATTPEGDRCLREIEAPDKAVSYLEAVVDWARPLTFRQLVTAIYRRHPEQRANSVFQD